MDASEYQKIRQLFDDYLRMYSSRDDRLTTYFSEDFSGFTGGGDFLVKDREQWVAITRQDFAQVKDPIQANARGAAFIAAAGLGEIALADVPRLVEFQAKYQPNAAHLAVYDDRFETFVEIYRQMKGVYRKLNGTIEHRSLDPR